MKETFRKYLDRSFHRKFSIRKGHGEMRFLRHRNAEQMQPAWGGDVDMVKVFKYKGYK